ncbi:MAG: hypothetical protein ACBR12_20755 [Microcoleus sp.]
MVENEDKLFISSALYWERRYSDKGNSGSGSSEHLARFKADTINVFVKKNIVQSIIEYGCGDGRQLMLSIYPSYIGFDVSKTSIDMCRELFRGDVSKAFNLMADYIGEVADLTLSLDVIYHLVEESIFHNYMNLLFESSKKFVIIYSNNSDAYYRSESPHIKFRIFTEWIEKYANEWSLIDYIPNKYPYQGNPEKGSWSDFYFYSKIQS